MKIMTSYNIRIKSDSYALRQTVRIYTSAVSFLIDVMIDKWDDVRELNIKDTVNFIEPLIHKTNDSSPIYDFDSQFHKFPSYLRRAAIAKAKGMVSSYKSNLFNWNNTDPKTRGKQPRLPELKAEMPAFYKDNMFVRTSDYTARLKLYTGKDWVWHNIGLRKSDADYIKHHCSYRKEAAPVLRHKGKVWELSFAFEENHNLNDTNIWEQRILAVDLGINSPCTCSVMTADGTVLGRHFYQAPVEEDQLCHKINKLKKAQQHGARKTPKLWASVNSINRRLSELTATAIMDIAVLYNVDTIVFEHLDLHGRKKGSKKQRLHMWRVKNIQDMVCIKAHRLGIRISHICAWNTSKLAYDGSGIVSRGAYMVNGKERYNYSICTFASGKQYNCDLNATYNIGARYFIRELLKTLPETERLALLAEVPVLAKRSTCTWSSLISLHAALTA